MPDAVNVVMGVVAGLSGLILPRVLRNTGDGVAVAAVVTAALLGGTGFAPLAVLLAVGLLLVGGVLSTGYRLVVVLVAAVLLGQAMPTAAADWLGWVTVAAVVVAIPMVETGRRAFGPKPLLLMLAWVPIAIYAAVPDTEQITTVAVALAVVAVGQVAFGRDPSRGGLAAFVALIVWATSVGAHGRDAAIVGALGCFAVLILGPFLRLLRRRIRWWSPVGVAMAALHLGGAVAAARLAGIRHDMGDATTRTAVVTGLVLLVGEFLVWASPRIEAAE